LVDKNKYEEFIYCINSDEKKIVFRKKVSEIMNESFTYSHAAYDAYTDQLVVVGNFIDSLQFKKDVANKVYKKSNKHGVKHGFAIAQINMVNGETVLVSKQSFLIPANITYFSKSDNRRFYRPLKITCTESGYKVLFQNLAFEYSSGGTNPGLANDAVLFFGFAVYEFDKLLTKTNVQLIPISDKIGSKLPDPFSQENSSIVYTEETVGVGEGAGYSHDVRGKYWSVYLDPKCPVKFISDDLSFFQYKNYAVTFKNGKYFIENKNLKKEKKYNWIKETIIAGDQHCVYLVNTVDDKIKIEKQLY